MRYLHLHAIHACYDHYDLISIIISCDVISFMISFTLHDDVICIKLSITLYYDVISGSSGYNAISILISTLLCFTLYNNVFLL